MTAAIRGNLGRLVRVDGSPATVSNAGLVLGRYLRTAVGGQNTDLKGLYQGVVGATPPALYAAAFRRWEAALLGRNGAGREDGPAVVTRRFRVRGRLIVGLGGESVRETAVALHRLYGVPLIPGSALKGLAGHSLPAPVGPEGALLRQHRQVLFGEPAGAGYVTYFDAWYVPGSAPEDRPLALDVITVHHPRYYGSRGRERAPWDFDDPNPLLFLSARGEYLVALQGPTRAWAEFAMDLLTRALADRGIGAKTASGYGRLEALDLDETSGPSQVAEQAAPAPVAAAVGEHPLLQQVRGLSAAGVSGQIGALYQQAKQLPEPARSQVLAAIRERLERANLLRKWAEKPWVQELLATLAGASPDDQ